MKYYGVFSVCYDSAKRNAFERGKAWMALRAIEKPHDTFSDKAESQVYDSRSDNSLKCDIIRLRNVYAAEDRYRRNTRFRTKYFIHECDEHGFFLPNKKDQAAAMELKAWRDANEKTDR